MIAVKHDYKKVSIYSTFAVLDFLSLAVATFAFLLHAFIRHSGSVPVTANMHGGIREAALPHSWSRLQLSM